MLFILDGPHQSGMERYCPSDSLSEADRTTLERRGQLTTLPCCNGTGRSLDSAINKHMYLHHGGGGGRNHPLRKGGSDGEEGEIEEEDEDEVFMDEATRDRLQRERLLTNSDEGLGSQTASPVNRHNYRRSNHPPPQCCHSYTSVSSPEGRCTSPSSFNIPHGKVLARLPTRCKHLVRSPLRKLGSYHDISCIACMNIYCRLMIKHPCIFDTW